MAVFPDGASGKEPPCQCRRCNRHEFNPLLGRCPGGGHGTHSNILAWRIPWTEEPGGLESIGSQRVRHVWSDLACTHWLVASGSLKERLGLKKRHEWKYFAENSVKLGELGYRFKMRPHPFQSVELQGHFECFYLKYRRYCGMHTSPTWVPMYLPTWPAQIPCTHQPHRMPWALRALSFHSTVSSAKTSCPSWLPGNSLLTTCCLTPMLPFFHEVASYSSGVGSWPSHSVSPHGNGHHTAHRLFTHFSISHLGNSELSEEM